MPIIKDAFDAFITPRVWKQDRTLTVGASEIGLCARKVKYIKTKTPPDVTHPGSYGASERGNILESALWAPALQAKYGDNLLFAGDSQETFVDGPLSATPDGLLINQKPDVLRYLGVKDIKSNCIMLECKTVDPRVILHKPRHTNVMQVNAGLGLIRLATKWKPNFGLLTYVNASFVDEITEFVVPYNNDDYQLAKNRAAKILAMEGPEDFRPEGYIKGGEECEHCPFAERCEKQRHNMPAARLKPPAVDPQFAAEMTDMVRQAIVFKNLRDDATADYKQMQDSIKKRLTDKKITQVPGVVKWSPVKGRTSYDTAGMVELLGKKAEQFKRTGPETSKLTYGDVGEDQWY